jgi:hypothetical protein
MAKRDSAVELEGDLLADETVELFKDIMEEEFDLDMSVHNLVEEEKCFDDDDIEVEDAESLPNIDTLTSVPMFDNGNKPL